MLRKLSAAFFLAWGCFFSFASPAQAQDDVVIESHEDTTLPYRERRKNFGIIFAVNGENFYPSEYFSVIQNNKYPNFLDKNIPLIGAEFGVKYNFQLGSVAALVGYATGKAKDLGNGFSDVSLAITKADLNLCLDTLFAEPYVAPFIQVGVHKMDWTENGTVGTAQNNESFTTEPNYHYKVGLSFQLNWIERAAIDETSPGDALRSSGLENTYLDVFYTSYAKPSTVSEAVGQPGEANLQSDEYGVGLKLEF